MSLTKYAIEKNRITFTLLAVIIVMGLTLYQSLPRDSMPPYTVRVATVVTYFPGASPERVEQLVTDKIEKKIQEIPELDELTSNSRTGLSVVTVSLKDQVKPENIQAVWDAVRRKLDEIKDLPKDAKPMLNDDDIGVVYGIMLGLTSDGFSYAEMEDYADDIRDQIIKLPDAAKVELSGVQDERIFVEYDVAMLQEYGLTSSKLNSTIASTNILDSGGEIDLELERIVLEPTGNYNSLDDIRNTLVPIGDGSKLVKLGDITTIRKGYIEPATSFVKVNGRPALAISVSLIDGANIINLGEQINSVIEEWNGKLPIGLELSRLSSLDYYVESSINNFVSNLIQSIVIVLSVMLVFLGFRTGVIVASLIPIVTVMTLMVMGMIEMGLNQVSLAALIMALGMMVDNAIVVSESILVRMQDGEDGKSAAINACGELIIPLLISTLTTAAAFLSFYMSETVMGDIMGPIFIVISIALLSSWVISMSITSLLCSLFIKIKKVEGENGEVSNKSNLIDRIFDKSKLVYRDIIIRALGWKRSVVVGIMLLFFVSLVAFKYIPFVFFPDSDRNMISVDVNMPLGAKIETTEAVVASIEQFIKDSLLTTNPKVNGIIDWSSFIGEGPVSYDLGYRQDEPNTGYAHILVNTSSFHANRYVIDKLDSYCFQNFPNADVKVGYLKAGGGGTPIEIKVLGEDPDVLTSIAEEIKLKLYETDGTKNIKDDWGTKTKKFIIDIDQNRAQLAGVTNDDIATSLKTVLSGFKTGEYREDDKSIPIIMRSNESQSQTYQSIATTNIFSQSTGKSLPLSQVAHIRPVWQYAKFLRLDIVRSINISSEISGDANTAKIMKRVKPWLKEQQSEWPEGYSYQLGGDSKNSADNMGSVIKYLPLSAFIIILLLIIQFNSVRKTAMVLMTIPLGVIGVAIGLLVFRSSFGFMAFLGLISLAGIVINNAIVLLDRIEIEISENGRSIQSAIVEAGVQRFRPIMLTTFTTTFGLIPLYLGGGLMWEPMAITLMVGLMFGTIITLVFIPSIYSIMYRVNFTNFKG